MLTSAGETGKMEFYLLPSLTLSVVVPIIVFSSEGEEKTSKICLPYKKITGNLLLLNKLMHFWGLVKREGRMRLKTNKVKLLFGTEKMTKAFVNLVTYLSSCLIIVLKYFWIRITMVRILLGFENVKLVVSHLHLPHEKVWLCRHAHFNITYDQVRWQRVIQAEYSNK